MNRSTVGDNKRHTMKHRELTSMTPTDPQRTSTAERVNAWTEQAGSTLARIVLQSIESGETQLKGFEHVAGVLNRTAAACGFRWNGVLREQYQDEIERAKRVKTALRSSNARNGCTADDCPTTPVTSSSAMQDTITFLRNLEADYRRTETLVGKLERERDELSARVRELEKNATTQKRDSNPVSSPNRIHSDAQTLVDILQRVRNFSTVTRAEKK